MTIAYKKNIKKGCYDYFTLRPGLVLIIDSAGMAFFAWNKFESATQQKADNQRVVSQNVLVDIWVSVMLKSQNKVSHIVSKLHKVWKSCKVYNKDMKEEDLT